MSAEAAGTLAVLAVALVAVALAARPQAGPSKLDFYLAGRRVGVFTNACAICGDYFSAASFLGVAAVVYAAGLDGMWYATGFAAGFVPVLLFVVAPLRRYGEFSLADFLGSRFRSDAVRVAAVVVVQLVVLLYLVPQAIGSGITWELLVGAGLFGLSPYTTGVLASTVIIAVVVVVGGMRGATWNQALQFLFLLAILLWLATLAVGAGFSYPEAVAEASGRPLANPVLGGDGWALQEQPNRLHPGRSARFGEPGARYGALGQFGLLITLMLGTAGLPHVMNRYLTSPSGRAARMTTVWVLGLAGAFYALAVMLGTAARGLIPAAASQLPWLGQLTVEGVLRTAEHSMLVLGRLLAGHAGLALVAAGALVAIMSTISGLLIAAAASWGHDVYERYINRDASQRDTVRAGQVAVAVAAAASLAVALAVGRARLSASFPSIVAALVAWAFSLAGSALTPALILSIWWRGATARGVLVGMTAGTITTLALIAAGLVRIAAGAEVPTLMVNPTLLAGPLAVAATVAVSRADVPQPGLEEVWVRMHGTAADREVERLARLTVRGVQP